jgi:hypothetical protein
MALDFKSNSQMHTHTHPSLAKDRSSWLQRNHREVGAASQPPWATASSSAGS